MRRQKSAKTKSDNEEPKATKTLGVRYAELLKLREAIESESQPTRKSLCRPSSPPSRSKIVRPHFNKLIYLFAIAVAMLGWSWLLLEGLVWALAG